MIALISFFIIISITLILLRIATEILRLTGLSKDVAAFQARSAFTGTGFTTRETETIMNHPVRRQVVMILMFVRNIGFVTIISSLVLSFFSSDSEMDLLFRFLWIFGGLFALFLISKIKILDRLLSFLVAFALKRSTKIHIYDYENLLNLSGEYEVAEVLVRAQSWLADKSLNELRLPDEGILVLGIRRSDGYYIGTPGSDAVIYSTDRIVLYGREENLRKISLREKGDHGDFEHIEEIKRQKMLEGSKIKPEKKKKFINRLFFWNKKNE